MFASNLPYRSRKPKYISKFWEENMAVMKSDGPSTHFPSLCLGLTAPQPRDATTPSPCWASNFMTESRTPHVLESQPERAAPQRRRPSLPPRRWATTCFRLSLRPCPTPLFYSLQPLLKLSLLSLGPSLLQFVSIVLLLLNHGNVIFELVCVFYLFVFCLYFLIEINFSFKSLFLIWSLSL